MTSQGLVPAEKKLTTMTILGCKNVDGNKGRQILCTVWWEHFDSAAWVRFPEKIWLDPEICPSDIHQGSSSIGDMDPDARGGADTARELLDSGELKVYAVHVKRKGIKKQDNEPMRGNEDSHYYWEVAKFGRKDDENDNGGGSEDQRETENKQSDNTKTGKPHRSTNVEQKVFNGESKSNGEILMAIATMMAPKIQTIYVDISQAVGAEDFKSSDIAIESQRLYKENVYPTIEAEIISLYRTFSKLQ